jgi:hypothetical protein
MVYRVDGGVSSTRSAEPVVSKPEVKPNLVRNTNESTTNAAVYASRNANSQQADLTRFRLNAQSSPTVTQTAPPLTQEEARERADRIIADNGGKDHLDTEGVARDLADIARQNPADARAITHEIYRDEKVKDEDRDEIAQSFVQALSDNELDQLAASKDGQALLKEIETNLLDYPVHDDESADANRIRQALDKNGIFLGADTGIYYDSVDPVSISDDPNATPEEVAAYIKQNPSSSSQPSTGRYAYIEALEAHQDDAAWLGEFYSALGSRLAGQLISDTVSPAVQQGYGGTGTDPQYALAQAELVRDSLETMQKGGVLTQDGMNALVNSMPKNEYVATEIFAQSTNSELKRMFINAATSNGDDLWDAGALHVLNTMPSYQQEQVLNSLGEKLDPFIEGAMAGEREIISFADYVEFGIYANSDMMSDAVHKTTFGGVEKLLETANKTTVYYHAQVAVPEFTQALQNKIFSAVTKGLDNQTAFDNFKSNTTFKDELSKLFIRNGEDILRSQAPDGAFQDVEFVSGMTKFFELTLFSPNGGELRNDLMESVIRTMGNVGDASKNPPLSQSEYERLHNGWSQQDHVEVMGGLLGMVWQAADNQKTYIQNEIMQDEARKKEMVGLFVGMAFSFIPGAGDVFGKIAGEGASFLQQIPDKVISFTWGQGTDQLKDGSQDFLLSLLKGMTNRDALTNVDVLTARFRGVIGATNAALPNGETGELNLRAAFQSAFSFYHDLVDLP